MFALQVENRLQVEGQRIPNLTHPDVPVSNDEDAATVISLVSDAWWEGCWGEKTHTQLAGWSQRVSTSSQRSIDSLVRLPPKWAANTH